ncbi:HesA/MoeB/ThiF family protein [Natroniella acetigena]|uniref:HesA/MoeB/ThiF family protein n=1 Tax=Natroniella acetigena TaxID=52004 RepID=UPI00200B546F|nr:HesA/MoeB/ThiF family protein [Natroniella acetigena]MCK8826773.1 HesA/MoeB/ThiF family protein [Natroniella acetigena]
MDFLERQTEMFKINELEKLINSTILIAGAGGLGTHQALELQRIGIKKIYLMDYDRIELSNLNRQVLYGRADIGEFKAVKAKEVLDAFDLGTEIVAITDKIDQETELPLDVDLIMDALDNFEARFNLSQLACEYELPLIHGGISSWYGQLTTIIPGETPTLQEIFEEQIAQTREKVQAFSPVVAMVACLQVLEAVKVLLGKDETLANKLLFVDGKDNSIEKVDLKN